MTATTSALPAHATAANTMRLPRDSGLVCVRPAFNGMSGKVTAGARPSTHYAPEHRRTVDSGDHTVGAPHVPRLHHTARSRLARSRRGRHALSAVARHGDR